MPIEKYINFKIEWVEKHPYENWDFEYLSKHKDFKIEWVEKHPYENWNFDINIELIKEYFKIEWVEKFPCENWDFDINIELTENFFKDFKRGKILMKNWDFNSISKHKDFKIEWIEKFPCEYIDEYYDTIYENCVREYMAAYKIQQWWFKITMSPHYKIGRKFINRSYQKLCDE